jgi:hypothetical protein
MVEVLEALVFCNVVVDVKKQFLDVDVVIVAHFGITL